MAETPDQSGPNEPLPDGRGSARMQPVLAGLALGALIAVITIISFWAY